MTCWRTRQVAGLLQAEGLKLDAARRPGRSPDDLSNGRGALFRCLAKGGARLALQGLGHGPASGVFESILATQLAMNEQTWSALQDHGVSEGTELVLDYFDLAPGETEGLQLLAFIADETDYRVELRSNKK